MTENTRDGIFLASNTSHNTITGNVVDDNARDGIHLNGPRLRDDGTVAAPGANNNPLLRNRGRGNGQFDGADQNPGCDNNQWSRNRFVKVNQPCVADRGTGTVPPGTPPPAGENDVSPTP